MLCAQKGCVALAKAELTRQVIPRAQKVADQLGFELVEVCLDKENTGKYLRIYIDRPGGMDLDGCERFHRAVQPLVEDYDYDFLEVSSPGVDRPLKRDRDFERALNTPVTLRLFRAVDGRKDYSGILASFTGDSLTLALPEGGEVTFHRKACATVRPDLNFDEILDVDEDEAQLNLRPGDELAEE